MGKRLGKVSSGSVHQPGMAAGILAKKARLLVTNQLQYAPEATSIVYLEDGVVAASGTYNQISHNERFADLLHEYEVCILPYYPSGSHSRTHIILPCPAWAMARGIMWCRFHVKWSYCSLP